MSTLRAARQRSRARFGSAFTLIELMVVLVIIGISAALGVPRFLRGDAEARLEGEVQRMLLDFRLAKQAANKTGLRHFIVVKPPRNIEVWRTKSPDDYTFDLSKDTLVFVDSLAGKVQFGFTMTDMPPTAPVGFSYSLPAGANLTGGLGVGQPAGQYEYCNNGLATGESQGDPTDGWAEGVPGPPYLITVCGGPTADLTNGIAYFSTSGSDNQAYALGYMHKDIQLHLWRWIRGNDVWEAL